MKKIYLSILLISVFIHTNAQNVYIPDAHFKAVLVGNSHVNTNGDTEIQVSEAAAYTGFLIINASGIYDLTGIGAFTALDSLDCSNNHLTILNVSANTNLTFLQCSNNA